MLLVYSPKNSYRLTYILDLMLKDLLGLSYRVTKDEQEFLLHQGPKFSYADKQVDNEPFFYATSLLFERGIKPQEISVFDWEGSKAFYATHPKYLLPFDAFAAAFYLVTRYEEYLPHTRDQYDRFDARQSLAYKKGFLHEPVINRWAQRIGEILQQQFPTLIIKQHEYRYISTLDIDNAWAYREKGIFRSVGAMLRSLVQFDMAGLGERLSVVLGRKKDPYDTYDQLESIRERYNISCIYFFLLGDYGQFDKNVSASRRKFQSLIKSIADYNLCGIHPSYQSNEEPHRIALEQRRLSKVIRREVTRSRQHFLKLKFPDTYRQLIACDITDDYTMGYAQEIGFRAGICTSFNFYDLGAEQETTLRIHPFAVMDATLRNYMLLKPDEVLGRVIPMIRATKAVGGTFMSLWHNESLSEKHPWEGWQSTYEEIVKAATA
ncbi:MAG: hypothetical protein RIQ47_395 [Bacteroidota bacterium]|jgi:hypothetical protein